jgi:hypothetical protein
MNLPVYISMDAKSSFQHQNKKLDGNFMGDDIGLSVDVQGDRATITEPFNNVFVSMSATGLNAVNIIVDQGTVHVLGNYDPGTITFRCCVTLCGTTACCDHACVTCGSTTACC